MYDQTASAVPVPLAGPPAATGPGGHGSTTVTVTMSHYSGSIHSERIWAMP